MADASDIHGVVFKNGSATLLARVVGAGGAAITQATISAIKYTIYLLDANDPDAGTAVDGHTDVAVSPVSSVIFDALQTDDLWDVDATGYNFKHQLDVSTNALFSTAGRWYKIVVTITPASGQVIVAEWDFECR